MCPPRRRHARDTVLTQNRGAGREKIVLPADFASLGRRIFGPECNTFRFSQSFCSAVFFYIRPAQTISQNSSKALISVGKSTFFRVIFYFSVVQFSFFSGFSLGTDTLLLTNGLSPGTKRIQAAPGSKNQRPKTASRNQSFLKQAAMTIPPNTTVANKVQAQREADTKQGRTDQQQLEHFRMAGVLNFEEAAKSPSKEVAAPSATKPQESSLTTIKAQPRRTPVVLILSLRQRHNREIPQQVKK